MHRVYPLRAKAHTQLGEYAKAAVDARRAIELKPTMKSGWVALFEIEFSRGASVETTQVLVKEAEAALGLRGVELLPEYAGGNLLLNRRDEYERACRDAATRFADSTEAKELSALAHAAALTSDPVLDTEQVATMASRAVEKDPSPECQHVLGLCLLRDGKADEAIECFQQSLGQPWSDAPVNWLGLAIAHSVAGHDSEAAEWLHKAQESPDHGARLWSPNRTAWKLLLSEAEGLIDEESSLKDNDSEKTP
jgi:tetratricopeptide (TPR) repeat protein